MNRSTLTPPLLAALGLIGLGNLVMLAGAVTGWGWVFLVGALASMAGDYLGDRSLILRGLFDTAQLGVYARQTLREVLLLTLLLRASGEWAWTAWIVAVVVGLRAAEAAVERMATELLRPRLETRNLGTELPGFIPRPPLDLAVPGWAMLIGGGLSVATDWPWPLLVGAIISGGWALAWLVARMLRILRDRRAASFPVNRAHVRRAIDQLAPQVVLYYSGPLDGAYQLTMWLKVLEQLQRPVLIVLREYTHLASVESTTIPTVCIPRSTDLMDFRLPTVRVAFYVAHVGKNIHLMREPRMKHVFIGHGESDKVASVNPISKGFDEIWVAGPTSRQRWHAAKVGIRDDAIVEVGRPQLGGVLGPREPVEGRPFSILYAPTWEGWTSDPYASSLLRMGPTLVRWLLEQPGVRVVYKPHPLTGRVSGDVRAADAEIRRLIEGHPLGGVLTLPPSAQAWQEAEPCHLVITGPAPTLYECFNNADLLIGDISSVVPDFLASDKPYAIPNPRGLDHEAMRETWASARGAYILDPDPQTWGALLADAMGPDTMLAERSQLRLATLGPRYADGMEPWRRALADLIDRANAEWPTATEDALGRDLDEDAGDEVEAEG